jgi:excisionase family DNA binding protein
MGSSITPPLHHSTPIPRRPVSTDNHPVSIEALENSTADGDEGRRTYSVVEAAEITGIPARTLRDWIRAGRIATTAAVPPERGTRIPGAAVEALRRQNSGGAAAVASRVGDPPPNSGKRQPLSTDAGTLQAQLTGAHLAAKIAVHRMREARADLRQVSDQAAKREEELRAEAELLQTRLGLEEEQRDLLRRTAKALEAIEARSAELDAGAWPDEFALESRGVRPGAPPGASPFDDPGAAPGEGEAGSGPGAPAFRRFRAEKAVAAWLLFWITLFLCFSFLGPRDWYHTEAGVSTLKAILLIKASGWVVIIAALLRRR